MGVTKKNSDHNISINFYKILFIKKRYYVFKLKHKSYDISMINLCNIQNMIFFKKLFII